MGFFERLEIAVMRYLHVQIRESTDMRTVMELYDMIKELQDKNG